MFIKHGCRDIILQFLKALPSIARCSLPYQISISLVLLVCSTQCLSIWTITRRLLVYPPRDLFPSRGCQSVILFVHLLWFILATCFCFATIYYIFFFFNFEILYWVIIVWNPHTTIRYKVIFFSNLNKAKGEFLF